MGLQVEKGCPIRVSPQLSFAHFTSPVIASPLRGADMSSARLWVGGQIKSQHLFLWLACEEEKEGLFVS